MNIKTKLKLRNKNVTVFGYGITGQAVEKKLLELGAKVFVTDKNPSPKEKNWDKIKFEWGGHTEQAVKKADLIVLSPGVPPHLPILIKAKKNKIPIISEIELAHNFLAKPIIAITGTNGKTTTTTLIGEILKDAGYKVAVAGNIGNPLISVDDSELDYLVVEVSSYQLENIDKFRPWIAVMLNIDEDHLEHHGNLKEYIKAKAHIFKNQGSSGFLVYNFDDPILRGLCQNSRASLVPFSRKRAQLGMVFVKSGQIYSTIGAFDGSVCRIQDLLIPGGHNIENALAAAAVGILCRVPKESLGKTLSEFPGIEHRIEFVKKIKGITFINDSKGTNPSSTIVALRAVFENYLANAQNGSGITLIAGGLEKGVSLDQMCLDMQDRVRRIILIGAARDKFKHQFEIAGFKDIHAAESMEEAVAKSFKLSENGDVVLLSPACASFDMFSNFEERGRVFKAAVNKLSHA
jgi:UDP-N-acetylmuramoylalanine--D-glutamate ligase